jgi:hypothetical protein
MLNEVEIEQERRGEKEVADGSGGHGARDPDASRSNACSDKFPVSSQQCMEMSATNWCVSARTVILLAFTDMQL